MPTSARNVLSKVIRQRHDKVSETVPDMTLSYGLSIGASSGLAWLSIRVISHSDGQLFEADCNGTFLFRRLIYLVIYLVWPYQ